jgi:hypothetical protein
MLRRRKAATDQPEHPWGRHALIGVIAVAVTAGTGAAHAGPDQQPAAPGAAALPPIVLEAHVGDRTPEAIAALRPVLDELEQRGCAASIDSIDKTLGGEAPRPGILDVGTTWANIAQEIEIGVAFFEDGKFKDADGALSSAVRHFKRNPSLVALDTNEKALINAFVHLAMSQDRLKRTAEARATMVELQRMSSTPPDRIEYGPRALELYASSQPPAQARGRGILTITVSEPNAMIFVDNRYRGLGHMSMADVMPGPHTLLVQVPGTEGRQYGLIVRPNETAELRIDWQTDSRLHLARPWAGLRYSSESDREREAIYARPLAQRWGRRSVIVVGPTRLGGLPVLLGVVYPATGEVSGAFVSLSSSERRLRDLGRFLVDGTVSDGVNVIESGPQPRLAVDAPAPSARRSVLPAALTTTAGVLTVVAGATAYATTTYDPATASDDGKGPAVKVMIGGSALLGGGVYLWLRETRATSRLTAGLLGAGVASLTAGAVLYVTDQDPGPRLPPYIRDSATGGVVLGASGLALAGLGAWLFYREGADGGAPTRLRLGNRGAAWSPVVVVGASTSLVGCAGSF